METRVFVYALDANHWPWQGPPLDLQDRLKRSSIRQSLRNYLLHVLHALLHLFNPLRARNSSLMLCQDLNQTSQSVKDGLEGRS